MACGVVASTLASPGYADVPEKTRVDDILGNSSELLIRRSGRRESIYIGTEMQQIRDALITVPPNNARALLRFLSANGADLNFYVQTNPHPEASIYYFPCQVQGGDFFIGWGLAANAERGCENGMQVSRGRSPGAHLPLGPVAMDAKAIAQAPVRQISYCTAVGSSGAIAFATTTTGNPCEKAMLECEADGAGCQVTSMGSWWTSEEALTAALTCVDAPPQKVSGDGTAIADLVADLAEQTQGTDCGVQVYRPSDVVIVPAPDDVVQATGSDEVLVQTRDVGGAVQVDVLKGAINVQSTAQEPQQTIRQGERYVYSEDNASVTSFDRDDALTSIDMEVLCAFASNSEDNLRVSACKEGLGVDTTAGERVEFCNREQESGGQEINRRVVQMSASQGEVYLEYEMHGIPDRLQIIHEGVQILDTGSVSGSAALTVPINGRSGRLEVILTGNIENAGTAWSYLLRCQ